MITSDWIALGAVFVSLLSIGASIFIYVKQIKYIKTQDDLNMLLLKKEKKEIDSADEALVLANVVKMGSKINRIRIFNKGYGRANNVQISYPENHNWEIINDVLPIEFLEPGQSVDLKLALYTNSQSKIKAILSWSDKKGDKNNEVILTL